MKVKDVMTVDPIKSSTLETKLYAAAKIMKDSNRGALPVVDKDNKVIGMVTDRDICLALATEKDMVISELSVKDAIPKLHVYTIHADDTVTKALQEMRKNNVGRLPVTDNDGKLKGLVSINNILSHAIEMDDELVNVKTNKENLTKTIKSLFDRNNEKQMKTENISKELSEVIF